MTPSISAKTARNPRILVAVIYLTLAWTFANVYDYVLPHNLDIKIEDLVNFSARMPMQSRVLVPAIINVVSHLTSLRVDTLNKACTIVSVWAIFYLFARFLSWFMPQQRAWIAAPLIAVPLFWNYCLLAFTHYPSDLPGIAFFLALLLLWQEKKMPAVYVVFLFACFNRETILFVLPCVAFLSWRSERLRNIALHGTLMIAIWVAVRALLLYAFRNSPGQTFENHLSFNVDSLLHGWSLGMGVFRYFVFLFGGLHILAFALWKWTPTKLRTLLMMSIVFLAGMFPVGILLESRIFGEVIPIFTASVIVASLAIFMPDRQLEHAI